MLTSAARGATEFKLQKNSLGQSPVSVPAKVGRVFASSLYLIGLRSFQCCIELCICLGFLPGQESTVYESEANCQNQKRQAGLNKKSNLFYRSESKTLPSTHERDFHLNRKPLLKRNMPEHKHFWLYTTQLLTPTLWLKTNGGVMIMSRSLSLF